ncbi:MAG: TIGR02757 family protein [Lentisphaerota bacterium]
MTSGTLKNYLDHLYTETNKRCFVHPDPLETVLEYDQLEDREIVALLASVLAYGQVGQILRSLRTLLSSMNPGPSSLVMRLSYKDWEEALRSFKHRWTTGEDVAGLLWAIRRMKEQYGSLQKAFRAGWKRSDDTILPALVLWVDRFDRLGVERRTGLLPSPEDGSACKRMNLFLRWMVRKDEVDPGGWEGMRAAQLIVPLDVHMHRVGLQLGLTTRRQADLKTAMEVTDSLRRVAPDDPVRYDFSLTRAGISRRSQIIPS